MSIKRGYQMLEAAVADFSRDDAMSLVAALAFYAALSMAPLLLIFLAVTSLLGPDIQKQMIQQMQSVVGEAETVGKLFLERGLDKEATARDTTPRDRSGPSRLRVVKTPGGNRK